MSLDIEHVRSQFPALALGYIFADNAGGSQVTSDVIKRITDYLTNTNVQLGADYSVGQQSTQRVADGAIAAKELFNASSSDEVCFGSSSTSLVSNLTQAMENDIQVGDEFIITGEHEGALLTHFNILYDC
jgi:selenocysteine lyase/cysteine desulfurase